jgi:release factor glutamine methyltransferase
MRLAVLPGVFRPHSDSWLLARHLHGEVKRESSVADLCTGSGLLAVTAALAGATSVTAVDVSRRAIATAWLNALLNGAAVEAIRGNLFEPLAGRRFDVIVSNPPYVPAADDALPTSGPSRAWDAGRDGRTLLDRICVEAPAHLRSGGRLLLVHSDVCDPGRTVALLAAQGLEADVIARERGPLGPLLDARRDDLALRGLLDRDAQTEELVVVRGRAQPDGVSRSHGRGTHRPMTNQRKRARRMGGRGSAQARGGRPRELPGARRGRGEGIAASTVELSLQENPLGLAIGSVAVGSSPAQASHEPG